VATGGVGDFRPRTRLRSSHLTCRACSTVKIVEDTATLWHFVIQAPRGEGELTGDDLDQVAGGLPGNTDETNGKPQADGKRLVGEIGPVGNGNMRPRQVQQTRASFDYQWSRLPPNNWSLENDEFREKVPEYICRLTRLPRQWFVGKEVLDAGCGVGRHTFGLCRLGARVTAVDQSSAALFGTRTSCASFQNFRGVVSADLLCPLPFDRSFDLVWSYGVLHHTGDTYRAFRNVAGGVKAGGYLFVMVYGEPRNAHIGDYRSLACLELWRQRCGTMSFPEKVEALKQVVGEEDLLGYFDAVSPWINDLHGYDELRAWFAEQGFADLVRLVDQMDHYLIARRTRERSQL
jgi:SAM-dependent methyltransferase